MVSSKGSKARKLLFGGIVLTLAVTANAGTGADASSSLKSGFEVAGPVAAPLTIRRPRGPGIQPVPSLHARDRAALVLLSALASGYRR